MYQVPRELRSPGGVLERSPICLAPSPPASSVSCLSPLQVLFNQFKYFFNLYFLLLACSQFVPEMRLGALYTYWVPLVSQLGHPFGGVRGGFCPSGGWNRTWSFKGADAPSPTCWEPPRFSGGALFRPPPGPTAAAPGLRLPSVCPLSSLSLFQQAFPTCSPRVAGYWAGTQWSRERQGLRPCGLCSLNCFLFMM